MLHLFINVRLHLLYSLIQLRRSQCFDHERVRLSLKRVCIKKDFPEMSLQITARNLSHNQLINGSRQTELSRSSLNMERRGKTAKVRVLMENSELERVLR